MATAARIYGPGPDEPFALRPVPDLAGTEVFDVEGKHAGTVYGSLVDAASGLIRYIDLALADSNHHVLVPIGHTRLRPDHDELELRAATIRDLQQIPTYEPHQPLDGEYQRRLLAAHGRLFHGERYYAHPAYDHGGLYAGEHPIVHDDAGAEPLSPLRRLSEIEEYDVAGGEPDIRGWPLVDTNGRRAGTIEDLLFDPDEKKVRYALLRPQGQPTAPLTPIPVGLLEIAGDTQEVHTPTLSRDDLQALPPYYPGHFNRPEEDLVLQTIATRLAGPRHYDRPDFKSY